MEHLSDRYEDDGMKQDVEELRCAVGLESHVGTRRNLRAQPLG